MQIANKKTHTKTPRDVYVGRPSPLGNPYSHRIGTAARFKTSSVEESLALYRIHLNKQLEIKNSVVALSFEQLRDDSVLVCWCSPNPCHADIVKEVYYERKDNG